MNQYLKIILGITIIAVINVSLFYLIIDAYPYDWEDCTEVYFTSLLILKGILTSGAIISISIFSAIMLVGTKCKNEDVKRN